LPALVSTHGEEAHGAKAGGMAGARNVSLQEPAIGQSTGEGSPAGNAGGTGK
jgi:hypothetical protein